jgi:oligopeptide/dipeptide ABC transporter ATP-binding protein
MTRAERLAFHRRVQLVFQNPSGALNPRMSVAQTLGEALRVHRICARAEVPDEMARLLALVRLPTTVLGRRPHEFSGGQLQRIALARALSVRPEIVVADEIVSALDVSVQAQIVNLLITLQRELGLAIVFIAHDLRLVRHISHRVAVMYRGSLVEIAGSEALFETPAHPYPRLLITSAPSLDPAQRLRDGGLERPGAEVSAGGGCVFQPRCPVAGPRCAAEAPRLRPVAPGRMAACHRIADAA